LPSRLISTFSTSLPLEDDELELPDDEEELEEELELLLEDELDDEDEPLELDEEDPLFTVRVAAELVMVATLLAMATV
jgi:hypothetical protein